MKMQYKNKLQMMEFEKKSIVEQQKSESLKHEQELLDQVSNLTSLMKDTKRSWRDNITELEIMVQEQRHSSTCFNDSKSLKL